MRPSLIVQTVVFHDSDRKRAHELATSLFDLLTRPVSDPLGFGAGIPVFSAVDARVVDLKGADQFVLVPVLGVAARAGCRDEVVRAIEKWLSGIGKGQIIVVTDSESWNSGDLPKGITFCKLSAQRRETTDRILLSVAESLGLSEDKPTLFISHSGEDPSADDYARRIREQAVRDQIVPDFFAQISDSIDADRDPSALDRLNSRAVFVAVRTDNYAARARCADELHRAKAQRIPTLTIEVLQKGEARSDPYGGNGPTMVSSGDPVPILSRAMIEWIRNQHFQREAQRVATQAGLPEPIIISRPPALFDLAQKELSGPGTQFVIYPDPELPAREAEVLWALRPRVYTTTPITAYRHLRGSGGPSAPLDGKVLAISLSDSPDVNGTDGVTERHVEDVITYVDRALVSAGATIAYGGDQRVCGYTNLFAQMMVAYNRTALGNKNRLRNYRPADAELEDGPVDIYHVDYHHKLKTRSILPSPRAGGKCLPPLYLSDMRRLMAEDVDAMIVLGGKVTPKGSAEPTGYSGRFPGIVEEAWRMLELQRPVYIVGGFGGASGIVASLMRGEPTPPKLTTSTWAGNTAYQQLSQELFASGWEHQLGLPASLAGCGKTQFDLTLGL